MGNKHKFVFIAILICLSIAAAVLLDNKKEYINIALDVNNDPLLIEESGIFIKNLKTKLEGSGKYKVILTNDNDGEDYLDKRSSKLKDKEVDLVINFDNSLFLEAPIGIEIYIKDSNTLKFPELLKEEYEKNEILFSGIFYPCLSEIKENVFHVEKVNPGENSCELTIDIFNKYPYDTVVLANVDFSNENLVEVYYSAIESFFTN